MASGEFLAFVDADDLWAPDKIEQQLRALEKGGPNAGFAYCWTATIDAASTVLTLDQRPSFEGQVLRGLCAHNFVGNGSSMLVRRSLFDAIGGFDTGLRAQGAEGCEDYLFCLEAAERAQFRVVPRFLLGYRQLPTSMARNGPRMQRSLRIVLDRMRARHPEYRPETDRCFRGITWWLVRRALRAGQVADAWHMTNELPSRDRRWLLQSMAAYLRTRVPGLPTRREPTVSTPPHPPHFALLAEVEDHDTLPEDVSALAVRLPPSRTLPPSRPELRHELIDG